MIINVSSKHRIETNGKYEADGVMKITKIKIHDNQFHRRSNFSAFINCALSWASATSVDRLLKNANKRYSQNDSPMKTMVMIVTKVVDIRILST